MSGIVKSVRKVFKKVVDVVKKIAPYIIMAVAIYFTAGLALSFTPAAGFAASMPGFASGGLAGALGSGTGVAGGGIFSSVASSIGMGGGLAAGASSVATAGLSTTAVTTGMLGSAANISAAGTAFSSGVASVAPVTTGLTAATGAGSGLTAAQLSAGNAAAHTAGGVSGTVGSVGAGGGGAGLSASDKLLRASLGMKAIGALLGTDKIDEIKAEKTFEGSFYGVTASGEGAPAPGAAVPTGTPGIGLGTGDRNAAAPVARTPGLRTGEKPLFATEGGSGPIDRAQFQGLDPLYPTTEGAQPKEAITQQRGVTDANPFIAGVYG